jgi:branched-chain amino acid transport system permease protein
MGSLSGALLASILIGQIQTFAVALDWSLLSFIKLMGSSVAVDVPYYRLLSLTLSEMAPILPYLLLLLVLIFRPKGLLGNREG